MHTGKARKTKTRRGISRTAIIRDSTKSMWSRDKLAKGRGESRLGSFICPCLHTLPSNRTGLVIQYNPKWIEAAARCFTSSEVWAIVRVQRVDNKNKFYDVPFLWFFGNFLGSSILNAAWNATVNEDCHCQEHEQNIDAWRLINVSVHTA